MSSSSMIMKRCEYKRLLATTTEIFFKSLEKSTGKNAEILHQVRKKFPIRSRLRSIVWKQRHLPMGISRVDIQSIRGLSSRQIPKGDKKMTDSFVEVVLPFLTDLDLRAEYLSIHGGLRLGKLMEDLDSLAGSIAYLYCDDAEITLVTAAVDKIDVLKSFDRISDVRLRGFVTYVGKSSIEITMAVEMCELEEKTWEFTALAKFLFVARTMDGSKSVKVPRLILETNEEREIFKLGEDRHQYRLKRNENSLFRQPPTEEESRLLHSLLISPPANYVSIHNTQNTSLKICHPQERNVHGFMFGGYLMREAYELAYTTALIHTKGRQVETKTVDDINFVHPVPVGSLLSFSSSIIYSNNIENGKILHVEVIADVIDPKAGSRLTTNTFHFNFLAPQDTSSIIPETYTEAMKYLEGKRRLQFCIF